MSQYAWSIFLRQPLVTLHECHICLTNFSKTTTGDYTCKPGSSHDHLDLQKKAYIHLPKKKKKMLNTLTWELQKVRFNKNKNNVTLITFSQ